MPYTETICKPLFFGDRLAVDKQFQNKYEEVVEVSGSSYQVRVLEDFLKHTLYCCSRRSMWNVVELNGLKDMMVREADEGSNEPKRSLRLMNPQR